MEWESVEWIHLPRDRDQWRADFREHGNEPSGSIKGRVFRDYLSDYQLVKKDSAPWKELVMKTDSLVLQSESPGAPRSCIYSRATVDILGVGALQRQQQ